MALLQYPLFSFSYCTQLFNVKIVYVFIFNAICSTESFFSSKWFPTICVIPHGLIIFEDKGYIDEVIAALLISTHPPFIPGINPYGLWS